MTLDAPPQSAPPPEVSRFAPSTTGPAHPGTLLAALLCWLDARARGARLVLRLEDLDPQRSRPEWVQAMQDDLSWLGLDWDQIVLQSQRAADHEAALGRLEAKGALYPCACSRSEIRAAGTRLRSGGQDGGPGGGWVYANRCRPRALPPEGWRASTEPLRARLPEGIACEPGDPIVRGREGGVAYPLASVVDDAASGVTRVVRGRDLEPTSATQMALQQLLGLPRPTYHHHLLLLEERGDKLAKFHGAVAAADLRRVYSAPELCGWLAHGCGLRERPEPTTPRELLPEFDWARVETRDRLLRWTGEGLELVASR